MAFIDYKYEGDDGDVYLVRMDPDLKAAIAGNDEPAGAITKPFHLATSPGRRNFGINPRSVTATRSFGVAPNNGTRRIEIPILSPATIEGDPASAEVGGTFTYKTFTWTISSVNPETEK